MKYHFTKTLLILNYSLLIILSSCSVNKQISKQATGILLKDSSIATGHIGICIYEPATGKYWYEYNSTHYFIPASNTKLFTLYAGMKYLGDSLVGLRYTIASDTLYALPTGDPSFLNPEYSYQPAIDLLNKYHLPTLFSSANWKAEKFGRGWAWNDYNDDYMAERSALPLHANLASIQYKRGFDQPFSLEPYYLNYDRERYFEKNRKEVFIKRNVSENIFNVFYGPINFDTFRIQIPFVTNGISSALSILHSEYRWIFERDTTFNIQNLKFKIIKSIPSDSLFKPMMHRSDNFFAEQTLLMASNEHLGYMNDEKIIDTLLKTDLKDVPQKPKWVDGSGLSRYNLFTPKDFVYILNKMQNEFGLPRMKVILPTGGEGTLSAYFKKDAGFIYAKTGTLSNNCALSGYLITSKGKLLIFSILANNYITGASPIRRAEERFLEYIREKY